ncbi:CLUMA_CG009756, isoform A [Clunio marinus]|uniref:CLUMA_CG009756, isoform A n=1 Tax=Clunio marinus TaxID=568069 RepID=A0A1J1ID15_9DIPT|nr:CLUMA_CG009756, isoform A [Clunio marinus]
MLLYSVINCQCRSFSNTKNLIRKSSLKIIFLVIAMKTLLLLLSILTLGRSQMSPFMPRQNLLTRFIRTLMSCFTIEALKLGQ